MGDRVGRALLIRRATDCISLPPSPIPLLHPSPATSAFTLMFDVFYRALPLLLNVGMLSGLIFFMFAVLGTNLFGAVNTDQRTYYGLSSRANFKNFGHAMLTLLRVATGDDWSELMFDSMVEPPDCSESNPTADRGCGSAGAAYAFYYAFSIVGQWILLNLFCAVTLEQYADERMRPPPVVLREHVEGFHRLWLSFDPHRTGFVHVGHLPFLLRALPAPLGPFARERREKVEREGQTGEAEKAAAEVHDEQGGLLSSEYVQHRSTEGDALENVYVTITGGACVYFGDLLQALIGFAYRVNLLSIPEQARRTTLFTAPHTCPTPLPLALERLCLLCSLLCLQHTSPL